MNKFIATAILIVLTIAIGASTINGSGDGSVKSSLNALLNTASTQIEELEDDL